MAYSHVRIVDDADPKLRKAAFREVLSLDPTNDQAKRNLKVLFRKTGRWVEGVVDALDLHRAVVDTERDVVSPDARECTSERPRPQGPRIRPSKGILSAR